MLIMRALTNFQDFRMCIYIIFNTHYCIIPILSAGRYERAYELQKYQ